MVSASPLSGLWSPALRRKLEASARAMLMARQPHPTRIELVEVGFDVELRDGTRIRISESAWS